MPSAPVAPVFPVGPVPPVGPAGPAGPTPPVAPAGPVGPCGTVKFKIAADELPVFVTAALEPGAPVVVVPIVTVKPAGPVAPVAPAWANSAQKPSLAVMEAAGVSVLQLDTHIYVEPLEVTTS